MLAIFVRIKICIKIIFICIDYCSSNENQSEKHEFFCNVSILIILFFFTFLSPFKKEHNNLLLLNSFTKVFQFVIVHLTYHQVLTKVTECLKNNYQYLKKWKQGLIIKYYNPTFYGLQLYLLFTEKMLLGSFSVRLSVCLSEIKTPLTSDIRSLSNRPSSL